VTVDRPIPAPSDFGGGTVQTQIACFGHVPRRGGQGVGPTPVDGHRGVDGEVRRRRAAGSRAGVSGLEKLSSDFYDHLAFSAPLFDVGQGIRGRLEWKYPVYNGTYDTGIDEGAELA
jgi:hypothetical protein